MKHFHLSIARRDHSVLSLTALVICLASGVSRGADAPASSNTRPAFPTFKNITERNIFNTKRSATYVRTERPTTRRFSRSDSFALVGTLSYEKGPFAFFEGSSSDFQKVLKQDDSIAGFKIAEIQPSLVKLASPSNQIELKIGMQLARQDEGAWQVSLRPENLDTSGFRTSASRWTAQPAAPRTEPESSERENFPFQIPEGFRFGGEGGIPPGILQAIQGSLPQGVVLPGANGGNDQNTPTAIIVPAPQAPASGGQTPPGGGGSEADVLRILRERRERGE